MQSATGLNIPEDPIHVDICDSADTSGNSMRNHPVRLGSALPLKEKT
jgi:hypothetical protein